MSTNVIRTATGWSPIGLVLSAPSVETLEPQNQGWWMKDAKVRNAYEAGQVLALLAARDLKEKNNG